MSTRVRAYVISASTLHILMSRQRREVPCSNQFPSQGRDHSVPAYRHLPPYRRPELQQRPPVYPTRLYQLRHCPLTRLRLLFSPSSMTWLVLEESPQHPHQCLPRPASRAQDQLATKTKTRQFRADRGGRENTVLHPSHTPIPRKSTLR
jgi:hypothetical protein